MSLPIVVDHTIHCYLDGIVLEKISGCMYDTVRIFIEWTALPLMQLVEVLD